MVLGYFFKKKKKEKLEIKTEEVSLDEIKNWVNEKERKIEKEEKEILDTIGEKIKSSILDIYEKEKCLEDIDIESKKEEEKVKIIVRQSLDKYINLVKVLKKELKETKRDEINQFIRDIDGIFSRFGKQSYIFYERANYIIGDELLAMKQEVSNLSEYFTNLFNKNKKTLHSLEIIKSIKSKLEKLEEMKKSLITINTEIKHEKDKQRKSNEEIENILKEIKKTKTSKEHIENIKEKENVKLTERKLEKSISELKSLINFKKLSNAFHSNEKKMREIKSYKEDFKKSFEANCGKEILNLINEAEIKDKAIYEKIREIKKNTIKISKEKKNIKKDKVEELEKEIISIKINIKNQEREEKIKEKITKTKQEMIESIASNINQLDATLLY